MCYIQLDQCNSIVLRFASTFLVSQLVFREIDFLRLFPKILFAFLERSHSFLRFSISNFYSTNVETSAMLSSVVREDIQIFMTCLGLAIG
jgi:hypothetical protein